MDDEGPRSMAGAMTSPVRELEEPFEDEAELLGITEGPNEEDEEGEELFGDNMEA